MSSGCGDGDCGAPVAPSEEDGIAVVLGGSLPDLQRALDRLAEHGIEGGIVNLSNAEPGSACCSPKLCLVVATEDRPAAFAVFDAEWKKGLSDEQIAALEAAAAVVLDPDAADTTCPACLATFATGPAECPDCGLALLL